MLITTPQCYYCGKKGVYHFITSDQGRVNYLGIDRVDNNLGYVLSNCVGCCKMCNKIKGDCSIGRLQRLAPICRTIAKRLKS